MKDMDQSLAQLRDGLPRIWWSIYVGCVESGFNSRQSLGLVQTFILSQSQAGAKAPDPPVGDVEDDNNS